jgi:hypothetical protein
MRKTAFLVLVFLVSGICLVNGQNTNTATVKLSGLIKTDLFYDSRQTVNAREGHFFLYPAAQSFDPDHKDLNDAPSLNFLPIQSNLSVNVSEIEVGKAKVSGLVEGDFFGGSNTNTNMLRMRHAYLKLRWEKAEIIAGQSWHPFFAVSCFPSTLSFNTGSPVAPFSRAPQVGFSYLPGIFRLSFTMLTQRDYCSNGPEGASSKYLRDSHMPELIASAEMRIKGTTETVIGGNIGYKKIRPEIKTGKGYQTSSTVDGISAELYLKYVLRKLSWKIEGIYLENGSDLLGIGGYVVKDTISSSKGIVSYVPLRTASIWSEISYQNDRFQTGIFAGYSECIGAASDVKGPFYFTMGMPVKSVLRVSPRFLIKAGPVNAGIELEYTRAGYGTGSPDGKLANPVYVHNTRLLTTIFYRF